MKEKTDFPANFINRPVCGDALEILKQIPGESVDLVVTDPPYGDDIDYSQKPLRVKGNQPPLLCLAALFEFYRVLKRNAAAYIFFGTRHLGLIDTFIKNYTGFKIRDILIWDKVVHGRGHGFRYRYEAVLALEKGKPRYNHPGLPNVLAFPRLSRPRHPHEKPLELVELLIKQSSRECDLVLDPFLGSGTTAVAARRLSRNFTGVEINPGFCQYAKQRLAGHELLKTSRKAASPATITSNLQRNCRLISKNILIKSFAATR